MEGKMQRKGFIFLSIALISISVITACGASMGGNSLEAEQAIRDIYASGGGIHGWHDDDISEIEIAGKGKITENDKNFGYDEVYCVNIKINATRYFIWFSGLLKQRGDGDYWNLENVGEGSWNLYDCPGELRDLQQVPVDTSVETEDDQVCNEETSAKEPSSGTSNTKDYYIVQEIRKFL